MSTSRHIDQICIGTLVFVLIITLLFVNSAKLGVLAVTAPVGYETRLFNTSVVHSIDIVMDDWDSFIEGCTDEQYETCAVVIDGEAYKNVAIRAKGNTSLSSVEAYGNNRYSFKIEFDHYDNANSYYGLDKLCLNNIIQDNTYMKDYLAYQMMAASGANAPLCSFAYITVNNEDWGLYLAIEAIEDAFLLRNYGGDYGKLYKPDSSNLGGGRGNGRDFDMENFQNDNETPEDFNRELPEESDRQVPEDFDREPPEESDRQLPDNFDTDNRGENPRPEFFREKGENGDAFPHDFDRHMDGENGGMRGGNDVSLIYTDDEHDSYSNIFENAKTDISDGDKNRLINSLKQLNAGENLDDVVDIEEVIRYFTAHNFVLNFDSYTGSMIHNYYLYEKDGKLSMIPWDYNLAFSGFISNSDAASLINYPIDTPILGGTIDARPMLAWIFSSEEYTDLYHRYFSEFISEYFESGRFEEMIDSVTKMIAPYVEKDPTKFCTYEEFETAASTLKEFCLLRAESIRAQLDGTIPSTSEGQAQDSSAFIDASDIDISSMGNMGKGMGHDKNRLKR